MVAYLRKILGKGDLSERVLELTFSSHPVSGPIGWFSAPLIKYFELWLLVRHIIKKASSKPKRK